MNWIESFRDKEIVENLLKKIEYHILPDKEYKIMEICGTHTVSISRSGLRYILPKSVRLISGPGCPVCVTAQGEIDAVFELLKNNKNLTIAVYGDLIRVPGSDGKSLLDYRGNGYKVKIIHSVLDILKYAQHSNDEIVFVSIGFETTTPQTAFLILEAFKKDINNLSILVFNKTMPEVIDVLLSDENLQIDGFLCPGHVSAVTGDELYLPMVRRGKAAAISGFEPVDVLYGILSIIEQVNNKEFKIVNNYKRVVKGEKNKVAFELINNVFEPSDAIWRGIGLIKNSGLKIKKGYQQYDAIKRYGIKFPDYSEKKGCRCGDVLKGYITPDECELFGVVCTADNPYGPCMVSSEGTCAAYYQFGGRFE
ncbi:MAG: hydrogenase formation protein HypD [Deferribacterales bacterium]